MASQLSTIIFVFSLIFFLTFTNACNVCNPKPKSPPPASPPKPPSSPPASPPKVTSPPPASPPKPPSSPPPSPPKPPSSPPPSPPKPKNPPQASPPPTSPPNNKCPPPPPPISPPPATCPKDTLKLGVCSDLLGNGNIVVGTPPSSKCCALIQGLTDLEAALCLCTAIKANVLGVNLNVPVTLSIILSACQKSVPSGFKCS